MKNYWISRLTVSFILCCFFGVFAQAQTPLSKEEALEFTTAVKKKAEQAESLTGEFQQVKSMDMLNADSQSSGRFYYQQPDSLKWIYEEPFAYIFTFKNGTLHVTEKGKTKAVSLGSNKLFQKLSQLMAHSLNGKMLEDEGFSISYMKVENGIKAELVTEEVDLKEIFEQIDLLFNSETYVIKQVKLMEPSGDYTQINFRNIQMNQPIEASVFE